MSIPDPTVDVEDFVTRAAAWRDTGLYDLHCGTGRGDAPSPLNARGRSNCSRYVLWLWELPGLLPSGLTAAGYGEVNTTAMYHEARGTKGGRRFLFVEVPFGERVQVGDAVVWPGLTVLGVRVKIGHTGGIVSVPTDFVYAKTADLGRLRISHCNSGVPPAIDETNGRLFAENKAIVIRLAHRW